MVYIIELKVRWVEVKRVDFKDLGLVYSFGVLYLYEGVKVINIEYIFYFIFYIVVIFLVSKM